MARDLQRRAAARLCRGAGRPSAASPASRSSAQARVASSPCRQRRGRPADRSRADNRGLAVVRAHRRLRVVHAPGPPQRGRPWQAAVHQAGITDLRARGWRRGSAMEAATLLRCGSWERACQWWCGPGSSTAGVALGAGPIPASKRLPIPRGSARIDANARIGHLVRCVVAVGRHERARRRSRMRDLLARNSWPQGLGPLVSQGSSSARCGASWQGIVQDMGNLGDICPHRGIGGVLSGAPWDHGR